MNIKLRPTPITSLITFLETAFSTVEFNNLTILFAILRRVNKRKITDTVGATS